MPWYKTGGVAVTINTQTVTGSGTAFAANARVGDAFKGPDGRWYEVINIASDTVLSISPAYIGPTVSGGSYSLAPMQGYVKDSADALRAIVNQYGTQLAALKTTGNYDILPLDKGGTGVAVASNAALLIAIGAMPIAGGVGYTPYFGWTRVASGAGYGAGQGGYTGWNDANDGSGLSGHMAFTSNIGGGAGGFSWRSVNQANTQGGPTMTYSYDGTLNVPYRITLAGRDVVTQGSNSNGFWTRYADGTQICHQAITINSTGTYVVGALFGSDAFGGGNYPATFVSLPRVTGTLVLPVGTTGGNGVFAANYSPPTATGWGSWRGLAVDNTARGATINLIAIGRWLP